MGDLQDPNILYEHAFKKDKHDSVDFIVTERQRCEAIEVGTSFSSAPPLLLPLLVDIPPSGDAPDTDS